MPISIPEALQDAGQVAAGKAAASRSVPRYLFSSALAGAYVGIAVVLLVSVSAPMYLAESPMTKLVQGSVFGIALTLVVFAGADLFTGTNMTMLQGLRQRTVTFADVGKVWGLSLLGNLLGALGFAGLVHAGGTMTHAPGEKLVASMVQAKGLATGPQLFARAVLCNALVCLAMWMAARAQGDAAKLIVLWWALLAFVASGFEHSIANMTTFGLAMFQGHATFGDLMANLVWTVPGNIVGGGLIIGLGYSWLGSPARRVEVPRGPSGSSAPVPLEAPK